MTDGMKVLGTGKDPKQEVDTSTKRGRAGEKRGRCTLAKNNILLLIDLGIV